MARRARLIHCAPKARQVDQGTRRRISIKASGQESAATTGRTHESNRSAQKTESPCQRGRPHINQIQRLLGILIIGPSIARHLLVTSSIINRNSAQTWASVERAATWAMMSRARAQSGPPKPAAAVGHRHLEVGGREAPGIEGIVVPEVVGGVAVVGGHDDRGAAAGGDEALQERLPAVPGPGAAARSSGSCSAAAASSQLSLTLRVSVPTRSTISASEAGRTVLPRSPK